MNTSGRARRRYFSHAFGMPVFFQSETDGGVISHMRATAFVPPRASMICTASSVRISISTHHKACLIEMQGIPYGNLVRIA